MCKISDIIGSGVSVFPDAHLYYILVETARFLSEFRDTETNCVDINNFGGISILNIPPPPPSVRNPDLSESCVTEATNSVAHSMGGEGADGNYQDIDIGNLDEALTNNCDPNVVLSTLKSLRLIKNLNKVIMAHLNINSISQKFDQPSFSIRDNVDILVVGETKLDDTFPDKSIPY